MAMSDCLKCWETPCGCGWNYIDWNPEQRASLIDILNKVSKIKEENPTDNKATLFKKMLEKEK